MVLIGCGGVIPTQIKILYDIKIAKIKNGGSDGVCQDNKYLLFFIVKYTCFSSIYVVDILKYTQPYPIPTRFGGLTPM